MTKVDETTIEFKAARFWSWFESNEVRVRDLVRAGGDKSFASEISRRVSILHEGLGWEAGPGEEEELQFALSPNRDRERLAITREVVRLAPGLRGWMFLPAKPIKSWNYTIDLMRGGQRVRVEMRNWQYRLTGFDDNSFFDVDLFPDRAVGLDDETCQKLGVLLVEGEIGEELLIERIDRITVRVVTLKPSDEGLTPISYLYQHLLSIVRKSA